MDQALRDLFLAGKISYDNAVARSHNAAELEVMISGGQAAMQQASGNAGGRGR